MQALQPCDHQPVAGLEAREDLRAGVGLRAERDVAADDFIARADDQHIGADLVGAQGGERYDDGRFGRAVPQRDPHELAILEGVAGVGDGGAPGLGVGAFIDLVAGEIDLADGGVGGAVGQGEHHVEP